MLKMFICEDYRKDALEAAHCLNYGRDVIQKIQWAKNDAEIERVMITARHKSMEQLLSSKKRGRNRSGDIQSPASEEKLQRRKIRLWKEKSSAKGGTSVIDIGGDALVIGVNFSKTDVGVLIVGRQQNNRVEIINAFKGDEARQLYEKLTNGK